MLVTIEHREQAAGVTGAKRQYFVDCTVEFSEEERAIIKARDLYSHFLLLGRATPPESGGHFAGTLAMRGLGPLVILAGVVLGIVSAFTNSSGDLAGFLFFGGIIMSIVGFFRDRKVDKAGAGQE